MIISPTRRLGSDNGVGGRVGSRDDIRDSNRRGSSRDGGSSEGGGVAMLSPRRRRGKGRTGGSTSGGGSGGGDGGASRSGRVLGNARGSEPFSNSRKEKLRE
ncbi:unnamed protein product, partial [Laminaria digitata]